MTASRGVEQDEMRRGDLFSGGSDAGLLKSSLGRADVKPVGRQGRPFLRLAVGIAALAWPMLCAAQEATAHPPRPRPLAPDRPHRPSYGRWSPGQKLPASAGAVAIVDYEQFHLRRPPRGYGWMQCDGDFILTNAAGLIFEVIPGGGR
jgi:hypothetical protein